MVKTTHSLYVLAHQQYPNDDRVLKYLYNRNESISCTASALKYIVNHFKQTMAHRKWLYYAFVLVRDSLTARDSEKIRQLVLDHDLSKFSAIEVLGYSFKFGRKKTSDPLKNQVHIELWDKALEHHYKNNPHHPQHYSDGGSIKSHCHLIQSILDILAWRMERNLAGHKESTTEDIFNVPSTLLEPYTEKDREKIVFYLTLWRVDVTSTPHMNSLGQKMLSAAAAAGSV